MLFTIFTGCRQKRINRYEYVTNLSIIVVENKKMSKKDGQGLVDKKTIREIDVF